MTRKPRHLDQWVLVVLGIVVAGVLLVAPLVLIFVEALSGGWSLLVINLQRDYMRSAILLTLVAAGLSVPVNVVFGILLAWCVTRFRFRGRSLLVNLVNIPYAMSPVVAGLCYVVVYGLESATGRWLDAHGVRVVVTDPPAINHDARPDREVSATPAVRSHDLALELLVFLGGLLAEVLVHTGLVPFVEVRRNARVVVQRQHAAVTEVVVSAGIFLL